MGDETESSKLILLASNQSPARSYPGIRPKSQQNKRQFLSPRKFQGIQEFYIPIIRVHDQILEQKMFLTPLLLRNLQGFQELCARNWGKDQMHVSYYVTVFFTAFHQINYKGKYQWETLPLPPLDLHAYFHKEGFPQAQSWSVPHPYSLLSQGEGSFICLTSLGPMNGVNSVFSPPGRDPARGDHCGTQLFQDQNLPLLAGSVVFLHPSYSLKQVGNSQF